MIPVALTVAGSDSGGGAGIQADLKTFAALDVYGTSAITAVTAQNTLGLRGLHPLPPVVVAAQISAVREDFAVAAVKVGMLASGAIAEAAFLALEGARIVYDPVMVASSGDALASDGFVEAARAWLGRVDLLTPNLAEAARLLDGEEATNEAEMVAQGRALLALGPAAVLMKGGHLKGAPVDLLVTAEACAGSQRRASRAVTFTAPVAYCRAPSSRIWLWGVTSSTPSTGPSVSCDERSRTGAIWRWGRGRDR